MDLQMRGIVIGFVLLGCVNVAYCINYTDYTLPSTITLNGNRSDTIISSKGNGQATTIGYNRNPHLTINGRANSRYALQVKESTTTFFSSGISVSSGIEANFTGIHTLAIQSGSVSIGNGATFNVISSGITINAQGSEYGGESKVRFSRGSSLELAQNATADFSNANFFIHDGIVNLSQGANLKISVAKAIRFQNKFISNGGIATFNGSVYNVGGAVGIQNTISTFTINGGNISVNGNFYNGLESKDMSVDTTGSVAGGFNVFDAVFGGGGNLIINGGNLSITGTLISRQGGTSINGGGIYDSKNSSISIYGGTLTTTGGVQNLAGSTLTIGADNSGKMGQIIGSVANSGTYIVDAKGAVAGNHTLITGTLTGGGSVRLINGNSDFANANLNGTTLSVTINQAQINHFKTTLNNNESATLTRFGDDIYTISGASSANLKSSANDINRAIFSAFYATNLAVMESLAFDSDLIFSKQRSAKRVVNPRQARQRQVRKISTKGANSNNINAGFIVQGISGDANGILGGIRAGYGVDFVRGRFALNFAYAYGNLKNALDTFIATQNLATKSHNLTLGANLNARFAGNFGVDLGLSGFMIFANHTREIKSNRQISSLKSSQNIYQIAVDLAFVYDFKITNFLIAPYLGLNQGFLAMPKFAEAGGDFALNAVAYNAYFLNVILGAKMGFDFGNYGAILGKIDYKFLAYNSQKTHILHYANSTDSLIFKIPNTHKIAFDLGYQKDFGAWYLRVNWNFGAIFNTTKSSDTNTNFYTYGLEAKFGWKF